MLSFVRNGQTSSKVAAPFCIPPPQQRLKVPVALHPHKQLVLPAFQILAIVQWYCFFVFCFIIFIHLLVQVLVVAHQLLSCGTWAPQLWHVNSQLWHACGIWFPNQGSNPGPLHQELGVLTTVPPGKPRVVYSFNLHFPDDIQCGGGDLLPLTVLFFLATSCMASLTRDQTQALAV